MIQYCSSMCALLYNPYITGTVVPLYGLWPRSDGVKIHIMSSFRRKIYSPSRIGGALFESLLTWMEVLDVSVQRPWEYLRPKRLENRDNQSILLLAKMYIRRCIKGVMMKLVWPEEGWDWSKNPYFQVTFFSLSLIVFALSSLSYIMILFSNLYCHIY